MDVPQKNGKKNYHVIQPFPAGYLSEEITLTPKNIYTSMFIEALFTKTKMWKQPKCPSVDERTKKTSHTHTHTHTHVSTGILFSHKK